jgi:hypothetical protein
MYQKRYMPTGNSHFNSDVQPARNPLKINGSSALGEFA